MSGNDKYEHFSDPNFLEYRKLEEFKPLASGVLSAAFSALFDILNRAENLLWRCTAYEIEAYANSIEWILCEHYEEVFKGERHSSFPPEHSMADAPRAVLSLKDAANHFISTGKADLQNWSELFSVIALLKVSEAIREMNGGDTVSAADAAIDAMDAVSYGEVLELREQIPFALESTAEKRLKTYKSDVAKDNADKGHGLHRKARLFIRAAWATEKSEYKNNKTEFARTYVGIVANKFQDKNGDPLKIKERTIAETWLSDPPPASK
jgi:hypothetical protein